MNKIFIFLVLLITIFCFNTYITAADKKEIKIGSKKFTESVILGEIIKHICNKEDLKCFHQRELGGTRILWSALLKEDIDIYPEYTGTLMYEIFADLNINNMDELKKELKRNNILMSDPLGFNNSYAIGMKMEKAQKIGITKISELNNYPDLKLGFNNEFMDRHDGWPGLRKIYNLIHKEVTGLDHDLAYKAIELEKIDVTDLYATDAEIKYYNLAVLEDELNYFKEYYSVFVYREELAKEYPDLIENLKILKDNISEKAMIDMNLAVKIEGDSESNVAASFLNNKFGKDITTETNTFFYRFKKRTKEHLFLVLVSLSLAILISIPLGILAYKYDRLGQIIHSLVGIVQTIPSLALLVFMIPLFGIGTLPALAALFLYSLLPIVRNTYSGLKDIPRYLHESADALGLSPFFKLYKIELPLASRSIISGIKTSAVINVGVATLGALIGAGGYGQPILTGIRLDNIPLILEGAIPAAVLALVVQGLFDISEYFFIPRGLKE